MDSARGAEAVPAGSVEVFNAGGRGRIVLACDHASNFVPTIYGTLGLPAGDLTRHIAWDPGAYPVAMAMARALDAPLVATGISRLVIDCNRPFDAVDLIPKVSETTRIPGNEVIGDDERARRIALSHAPFHGAIETLLARREKAGMETWLVSVHSFTPVYKGSHRPWEIGIIHDEDVRIAAPLIGALERDLALTVGVNQPYSPADRVYYTLERHARARNLPCAMIEIRNDQIADESGQRRWADRLGTILLRLKPVHGADVPASGEGYPARTISR